MTAIDRIVVDRTPWATRVAFLAGGAVVDLWIDPADNPSLLGGIALARVLALHPETASATLAIPGGEATVAARSLTEGGTALVQVVRDAVAGKRPVARLGVELTSGSVLLTSHTPGVGLSSAIGGKARRAAVRSALTALAPAGVGLLVRGSGADTPLEALAAQAQDVVRRWQGIAERAQAAATPAWVDRPTPIVDAARGHAAGVDPEIDDTGRLFEECGAAEALETALSRRVALDGGGELVVDSAEAATLIDVNLPGGGGAEGFRRANDAAGRAALRQMRLRGLRGIVLLDLPRMSDGAARARIRDRIAEVAAEDPVETRVLGWTPGGMLELVREGTRRPLADDLLTPQPEPGAAPRAAAWAALSAARWEARRIGRVRLCVAPPVAAWFAGPGQPILEAERQRLGALSIRSDPTLARDVFRVESED